MWFYIVKRPLVNFVWNQNLLTNLKINFISFEFFYYVQSKYIKISDHNSCKNGRFWRVLRKPHIPLHYSVFYYCYIENIMKLSDMEWKWGSHDNYVLIHELDIATYVAWPAYSSSISNISYYIGTMKIDYLLSANQYIHNVASYTKWVSD